MNNALTAKIIIFMVLGALSGLILKFLLANNIDGAAVINNILILGGNSFLALFQMLVIPIVFVSIVCGINSLKKNSEIGTIGFKAFFWFLLTTIIAALLALLIANIFHLGSNLNLPMEPKLGTLNSATTLSLWQIAGEIIPSNPFKAMAEANMLQIIVFSIMVGIALNLSGESGRRVAIFFADLNVIGMKYIMMLMGIAPYGVFCLMAVLFTSQGFGVILGILNYFLAVLFVLFFHTVVTFSTILHLAKLSPKIFFQKIYSVMLFAFGISSSTASIPVLLDTVENRLGVNQAVSSFVIPLGININKNGTAIMQGIATIFIANIYHLPLDFTSHLLLLVMIVLVSIGTSGAPSIGLITLVMILKYFGLPIEGISLIVGVDRLLDMVRTAVNVAGNATIACLIGHKEKQIDYRIYNSLKIK